MACGLAILVFAVVDVALRLRTAPEHTARVPVVNVAIPKEKESKGVVPETPSLELPEAAIAGKPWPEIMEITLWKGLDAQRYLSTVQQGLAQPDAWKRLTVVKDKVSDLGAYKGVVLAAILKDVAAEPSSLARAYRSWTLHQEFLPGTRESRIARELLWDQVQLQGAWALGWTAVTGDQALWWRQHLQSAGWDVTNTPKVTPQDREQDLLLASSKVPVVSEVRLLFFKVYQNPATRTQARPENFPWQVDTPEVLAQKKAALTK